MLSIGIVIPTWNSEAYIGELLLSIRDQRYENLNIVVVDNMSTDGTLEIVSAFSKILKIHVISEKDKGQADAVTKGLRIIHADIVHWHAADDIILPGAFSKVSRKFSENSRLDVVYSDGLAFGADATRLYSSWPTRGLTKRSMLRFFGRFQSDTAYWRHALTAPLLPLSDEHPTMVDEEFFVRLVSCATSISRIDGWLGVFRVRSGQISSVGRLTSIDLIRRQYRLEYIREHWIDAVCLLGALEFCSYRIQNVAYALARIIDRELFGAKELQYYYKYVRELNARVSSGEIT